MLGTTDLSYLQLVLQTLELSLGRISKVFFSVLQKNKWTHSADAANE